MRKGIKLTFFALVAFFLSITPAYARQMTLEELGKEVEAKESTAEYVYVVGQYAFTSKHKLTAQDLMVAAKSIQGITPEDGKTNDKPVYGKMAVYKIARKSENFTYTGWETPTTALGKEKLDLSDSKSVDIRYIDYQFIAEQAKMTVDLEKTTTEEVLKNYLTSVKYDGNGQSTQNLKYESTGKFSGKITGHLLKNTTIDNTIFPDDEVTGYYFAYALTVEGANENTTLKIGEKSVSWDAWDIQNSNGSSTIAILVSYNPGKTKELKLTVDIDGNGTEYEPTVYTIDVSGLTVEKDTVATFSHENIPQDEVNSLKNSFDYVRSQNDTYTLDEENGVLKFNGSVVEKTLKGFNGDATTGKFVVFTLSPEKITEDIEITIPCLGCAGGTKTVGYNSLVEDKFTIILQLTDTESKQFKITVDSDGAAKREYGPVEYTFDYTELKLIKESKSNVAELDSAGQTSLTSTYGWTANAAHTLKFSQTDNTVKVTGQVAKINLTKDNIFEPTQTTGYYMGYAIKLPKAMTENSVVTVAGSELKGDGYVGVDEIDLLKWLDPNKDDNSFDIVVDMEPNNEDYKPYTFRMDLTEITFQKVSEEISVVNKELLPQEDLATITGDYGYTFPANYDVTLEKSTDSKYNGYTLRGTINRLMEDKVKVFEGEEKTGYYFVYNVKPSLVMPGKTTISISCKTGENCKVTTDPAFLDHKQKTITLANEGDSLTVLYSLNKDNVAKCKEDSQSKECFIPITVDIDGEGIEYDSETYYLNIGGLELKEATKMSVQTTENAGVRTNQDGYTIHVAGLLNDNQETLNDKFKIAVQTKDLIPNETTITTTLGETTQTYLYNGSTFTENPMVASISAINQIGNDETVELELTATSVDNRVYTIVIDKDGPESDDYTPSTYSVDYNNLALNEKDQVQLAANRTYDVRSLTITSKNVLPSKNDFYVEKYDKDLNRKYTVWSDSDIPGTKAYTFSLKGNKYYPVDEYDKLTDHSIAHSDTFEFYTINKDKGKDGITVDDTGVYLNGWRYSFGGYSGIGVGELKILVDIDSIKEVTKLPESSGDEACYKVIISKEYLTRWLNNRYDPMFDPDSDEKIAYTVDSDLELTVKVNKDNYVTSMVTDITINSKQNRKIDLAFQDFETTKVEDPVKVILGESVDETTGLKQLQEFKTTYDAWWSRHTGSHKSE